MDRFPIRTIKFYLQLMELIKFKKKIFAAEVLLLDNEVAVFRSGTECKFYIAGPVEEVRIMETIEIRNDDHLCIF